MLLIAFLTVVSGVALYLVGAVCAVLAVRRDASHEAVRHLATLLVGVFLVWAGSGMKNPDWAIEHPVAAAAMALGFVLRLWEDECVALAERFEPAWMKRLSGRKVDAA